VLSLIDTQGAQISALSLPLQRASGGAREYLGNITLPAAAFRVRARGTDAQGRAYDLMSESFVATRFEARLPFGRIPVRGGQAVAIPLIVKNHGGAGQFELDVTLSAGLILHSEARRSFSLAAGETRAVTLDILPPPVDYFGGEVSVSIWRQEDSAITNGSAMRLRVVPLRE
jgi:hypothetical protein